MGEFMVVWSPLCAGAGVEFLSGAIVTGFHFPIPEVCAGILLSQVNDESLGSRNTRAHLL